MAASGESGASGPAVVVGLLAGFVFVSPFTDWWAAQSPPWYVPFALWAGIIALTAVVVLRRGRHDV